MADLLDKLPEELDRSPEAALLRKVADRKVYNIVHLNYRPRIMRGLRRIMSSHVGSEDSLREEDTFHRFGGVFLAASSMAPARSRSTFQK